MKKPLLFSGLILLIVFVSATFLIKIHGFNGIDLTTTVFLQYLIPRVADFPFSLFSLVGSLEIASIILLLILFLYKKMNYIYVLISFGLFHLFELLGKAFVYHPGPTAEFLRYYFSFAFPSSSVKPGSSFPSGHVGRTFFVSTILLFVIYNSKLSKIKKCIFVLCVLIFDILMFISRIYLGEHWLSDVLGGAVLGVSLALMSLAL